MQDLLADKCNMGKVPKLLREEIENLFDSWDKNKDGKISWQEFRDGLNSWEWRLMDGEEMQKRIDEYYEEANRKKVQGNLKEALQISFKALALQGCETKTQPIEMAKPQVEPKVKRGDVFTVPMFRNSKDKAKEIKIATIKS